MNKELKSITDQLLLIHGKDISMYDNSFLVKSIENRIKAIECDSFNKYVNYLQENKEEASLFFQSLNVNYSEFFRNPFTFAFLEQFVLPFLIKQKQAANEIEIRIWSAACASGQEAYSIAILCDEIMNIAKTNIGCRIFATDISEKEIRNAQKGLFQTSSLNSVTQKRIQTYFTKKDTVFAIAPKLKEHINFSVFNLLSEQNGCPAASIYGNFDLILCGNILFYYNKEHQKRILQKVGECLAPNGYLVTGETERAIVKTNNYQEVFDNSSIFQKKTIT